MLGRMSGGSGDDVLRSGSGDDVLMGSGDEVLRGGRETDAADAVRAARCAAETTRHSESS